MFGERFDLLALAGLLDERWMVGDLGCGTGQMAEALAPFVARVIAVESSRAMLKAARQRLTALDNVEPRARRARGAAARGRARSTLRPCASCCTTSPTRPRRCAKRTAC